MIHFAQPSNIWLIVYLSQYNMQPNKLLIVFSFVFLISLLTSKRKTHREWWTDNELVYELTFRPCRVEVYILHTEQIWLWSTFRPCRVDVYILHTEQIWLWSTFRPCRVDVYILHTEQIWLWSTYICIYLYQAGAELVFTYSSSTEQKFQTLFLFASSNVYSFLLLLNMNGQVGRFILR
jgi:hypothetical protein